MTKQERQMQLRSYWISASLVFTSTFFGFASGCVVDQLNAKEVIDVKPIEKDCGLYAGITDIDFETVEIVTVEEEETEVVAETYMDEYEYEMLAHLIYAEGGDNSYKCLLYIGSVIINRKNSPKFPNTVEEVIYEGNGSQYPTIKWMWGREPSKDAYMAAEECLTVGSALPEDVLAQTGFYIDGEGQYQGWEHYEKVDTEYFSRCVWRYR